MNESVDNLIYEDKEQIVKIEKIKNNSGLSSKIIFDSPIKFN